MKKIFLTCFLLSCSFLALADPHDCMSKAEAETLSKKILKQYIIDYCDCCDSVNPDANVLTTSAKLLWVTSAQVVPCSYDETRYSVKIGYSFVGAYNVETGKLKGENLAKMTSNVLRIADYVSLNYHFFWSAGKVDRLYGLLQKAQEYGGCDGLDRFPTAKEADDKKYKAFISKK
jgi:hypothetical protein